jgi:hypothetical protein
LTLLACFGESWRPMRRLLAATTAVFVGLVAAGLHGFSLPSWHAFLADDGPMPELLAGRPRDVRSDDWYVQIPLALAQRAHEPAFPRVNGLIGAGQDVILPIATPIRHPITLFRPEVWGFFLGADLGLAWMWWSRALGLFAVWACVAFLLAGRRTVYGALGGALVLFAPLMQLWSLNAAPLAIDAYETGRPSPESACRVGDARFLGIRARGEAD